MLYIEWSKIQCGGSIGLNRKKMNPRKLVKGDFRLDLIQIKRLEYHPSQGGSTPSKEAM